MKTGRKHQQLHEEWGSVTGNQVVAALATATRRLNSRLPLPDALQGALAATAVAVGADRAVIWQSRPERPFDATAAPVLRAAWRREVATPAAGSPGSPGENGDSPEATHLPADWEPPVTAGSALHTVSGEVAGLDERWRVLVSRAARSAALCAVTLPDGAAFVGFEDHSGQVPWGPLELEAVGALAGLVAMALARETEADGRGLLRELVEQIPAVLYIDEIVGDEIANGLYHTVFVTPQISAVLGVSAEEWKGDDRAWQRLVHPEDWEQARSEFDRYLERGGTLVQEYRVVRPDDGRVVWIRDDCTMIAGESSTILQGVMLDISLQKQTEEQLRTAEAKNRTLIEQIPAVVFIEPLGESTEPRYVSSSVAAVLGCSKEDWLGSSWWEDHLHPDDRERVLQARGQLAADGRAVRVEYRMELDGGRSMWIGEVAQVVSATGVPWMLQGLLEDVTSRKVAEEDLAFRAAHDDLTGLPNRTTFEEHLEQALARAVRNRTAVAVLFMDIDGFKEVNDRLGHDAGDQVIRTVAERVSAAVRDVDIVARRGGDEFLVLLADIEPGPAGWPDSEEGGADPATVVANMVTDRITEAMAHPVPVDGAEVTTSLSIGRSIFPLDANDFRSIMAEADAAMYRAKEAREATGR